MLQPHAHCGFKEVSKLVFYAQSTSAVILGQAVLKKKKTKKSKMERKVTGAELEQI